MAKRRPRGSGGADEGRRRQSALLQDLFRWTAAYASSEAFMEVMRFLRRFPSERAYNAYLVHVQNPRASLVTTARRWEQDYGGHVQTGAKPILVLRPFEPIIVVYDIADVKGHNVPLRAFDPNQVEGGLSSTQLDLLVRNAATEQVGVGGVPAKPTEYGSIGRLYGPTPMEIWSSAQQVSLFGRQAPERIEALYTVRINDRHDMKGQFTTLLHELAHLLLGHVGRHPLHAHDPQHRSVVPALARDHLPRSLEEFEAESVAFLVADRLGLDVHSEEYLAGYYEELLRVGGIQSFDFARVLTVASTLERWALEPPDRKALRLLVP